MSINKDKLEAISYILESDSVILSEKVISLYPTKDKMYTIICNVKRKEDAKDKKIRVLEETQEVLVDQLQKIEELSRRYGEE